MAEVFDFEVDEFADTFVNFLGKSQYSLSEMPDADFENDVRCSCEQLITKISGRAEKVKSQEKNLEAAQQMFNEKIRGVNERMSQYRKSLDNDYKARCKILEEKQLQMDTLKEEHEKQFQMKMKDLEDEKENLKKKTEAFENEKQDMERRLKSFEDEKRNIEKTEKKDTESREDVEVKQTTKKDIEPHECIIKLDVGGHRFSTSLNTLCKDQKSMVAVMFSGRHSSFKSDDGSYFIDRDGTYFQYILNYLRGGIVSPGDLPEDPHLLTALRREADFYQIRGFTELLDECLEAPGVKLDYCQEEITRMLSTLVRNDDSKDSHTDATETTKYQTGSSSAVNHNSMTKCKLSFTNKRLNGISFAHTTFLHDVSFRNARLVGASFYGCEFGSGVQINFNYSDLTDCDFRQCKGKENGAKRNFAHGGGLLSVSSSETFLQMVQEGRITFKRAKIESALFDSKVLDHLTSHMERK